VWTTLSSPPLPPPPEDWLGEGAAGAGDEVGGEAGAFEVVGTGAGAAEVVGGGEGNASDDETTGALEDEGGGGEGAADEVGAGSTEEVTAGAAEDEGATEEENEGGFAPTLFAAEVDGTSMDEDETTATVDKVGTAALDVGTGVLLTKPLEDLPGLQRPFERFLGTTDVGTIGVAEGLGTAPLAATALRRYCICRAM
jgi:hypothetical protein